MENQYIFSQKERDDFVTDEQAFVRLAKNGNCKPLFVFWQIKREHFLELMSSRVGVA